MVPHSYRYCRKYRCVNNAVVRSFPELRIGFVNLVRKLVDQIFGLLLVCADCELGKLPEYHPYPR